MAITQEQMDAFISGEIEPILPDGWDGESDLFAEIESDENALLSDGTDELTELLNENEEEDSVSDDPTTVEQDGEEDLSDETGKETETPDGEKQTQTQSRKLKLKVNHREEEVDIDAMSDDDLIAALQKSRKYEMMMENENKQRYRDIYNAQVEAGMTEAAAKLVAQNEVGKTYALTDEVEAPAVETVVPETEKAAPVRDFKAEYEQLQALYPDVKEIPDEVVRNAAKGIPLLNAYLAYRDKQSNKTAASLKKENEVLKQNAASAAKAPVKGVSGGGVAPKKVDPFLAGFESENW